MKLLNHTESKQDNCLKPDINGTYSDQASHQYHSPEGLFEITVTLCTFFGLVVLLIYVAISDRVGSWKKLSKHCNLQEQRDQEQATAWKGTNNLPVTQTLICNQNKGTGNIASYSPVKERGSSTEPDSESSDDYSVPEDSVVEDISVYVLQDRLSAVGDDESTEPRSETGHLSSIDGLVNYPALLKDVTPKLEDERTGNSSTLKEIDSHVSERNTQSSTSFKTGPEDLNGLNVGETIPSCATQLVKGQFKDAIPDIVCALNKTQGTATSGNMDSETINDSGVLNLSPNVALTENDDKEDGHHPLETKIDEVGRKFIDVGFTFH